MDTASLFFIGVVVSLLVNYLKKRFEMEGNTVLFLVVCLALVGSVIYTMLVQFGYLEAVLNVLVSSGAFYTFILKTIEKNS